jgi:hypothetical protein
MAMNSGNPVQSGDTNKGEVSEEELRKFKYDLMKLGESRVRKIKKENAYYTQHYYDYYKKNRPQLKEFNVGLKRCSKLINNVNERLTDLFFSEGRFKLPCDTGYLYINKYKLTPKIRDGKLKYTAPIN